MNDMNHMNGMNDMNSPDHSDHWLVRPTTISLLWKIFSAVLLLTVIAQLVISIKGYFGVDGWLGFGAVFGFLSCVLMVLVAKALGFILKREQDYFAEADEDAAAKNGDND